MGPEILHFLTSSLVMPKAAGQWTTIYVVRLGDLMGSANTMAPVLSHDERNQDTRTTRDKAKRPTSETERKTASLFPLLFPKLEFMLL